MLNLFASLKTYFLQYTVVIEALFLLLSPKLNELVLRCRGLWSLVIVNSLCCGFMFFNAD